MGHVGDGKRIPQHLASNGCGWAVEFTVDDTPMRVDYPLGSLWNFRMR
jgi:hypothetical protein